MPRRGRHSTESSNRISRSGAENLCGEGGPERASPHTQEVMGSQVISPRLRLRMVIRGVVQGVGFRPFVYRLATSLGLTGWVSNSPQGVCLEVEGQPEDLERFQVRLKLEKPPQAVIQDMERSWLAARGCRTFEIRQSNESGVTTTPVLPDLATCQDCLREIFDPSDRRYGYSFTNCTSCGPRFTIIQALPYDRPNTTMQSFSMCSLCQAEYDDPLDRRFHAQPNACPVCGPHLELWDKIGRRFPCQQDPLVEAALALASGAILGVKGLGGFHLMVDARNEGAVTRLRCLKHREGKPFAVMYPSLESTKQHCRVSSLEEDLLVSPQAPIVLLRRATAKGSLPGPIAPSVAPANPYLGAMLPYTPIHHLLMANLGFPVVATSGNLADEPICTDELEAVERLGGIADLFLVHNRPIVRHVDDSVVRVLMDRPQVLRRARGYAPLPISLSGDGPPILAVGAHLKNAVAITVGGNAFVSQHIGDLETPQAFNAFQHAIESLEGLYAAKPVTVACDLHPDYLSTSFALKTGLPLVRVQHHYAHVLSCMAENRLEGPALGIAWDGTGYGADGTVWGGEFLLVGADDFQRVGHFRPFRLPGGEQAVKEPRRSALGLLYELFGPDLFGMTELAPLQAFTHQELRILRQMLEREVNSPMTSSAGRLFDAVAAILGLCQRMSFEGQAAMALEFALPERGTVESYDPLIREESPTAVVSGRAACKNGGTGCSPPALPIGLNPGSGAERAGSCTSFVEQWEQGGGPVRVVDWEPLVMGILDDVRAGVSTGLISARFHNTLIEAAVQVACRVGQETVVLTGGCFQNRYLAERAFSRLEAEGFRTYCHQQVPPNDGGIALGQAVAAWRSLREK